MLTRTECDRLKPKDKSYKKFDGNGLYLEISPKGHKNWRLKYYFEGKEKRISLGKYPIVTLDNARQKRIDAKKLLEQGIDPSVDRQEKKRQLEALNLNTFEAIAEEWYKKQEDRWSKNRAKSVRQILNKNVLPFLGSSPISLINNKILYEVLLKIEKREAYFVTKRTNQLCGQIFKYAVQTSRCEHNPAHQLVGAFKTGKTVHFPSISPDEIPELLKTIDKNDARLYMRTRNAILFSMLTFCRPGEIRQARWQDINFEEKQWTIPAEFMKLRKEHIVPLSKQSLEILEDQREETTGMNSSWIFPARNNVKNPMSDGTVNVALKKLGFHKRMTAHGFRALARTAIREKLKYYPDVIEAQMAHRPLGALGAAYDRAQFIDERTLMMQDWADYIDGLVSIK